LATDVYLKASSSSGEIDLSGTALNLQNSSFEINLPNTTDTLTINSNVSCGNISSTNITASQLINSSAIDVSDGLLGDLGHILHASKVNANIWIDNIPCSPLLREVSLELRRLCTLKGGDDYELCFTAPSQNASQIEKIGLDLNLRLTKIGSITEAPSDQSLNETTNRMTLLDQNSVPLSLQEMQMYLKSFDHFDPTSII
jgi:thiamine-monophosphate kinase